VVKCVILSIIRNWKYLISNFTVNCKDLHIWITIIRKKTNLVSHLNERGLGLRYFERKEKKIPLSLEAKRPQEGEMNHLDSWFSKAALK